MFRPAPKVRSYAAQLLASLQLAAFRPFVAIHVRRTDKKAETGRYVPFEAYLAIVRRIATAADVPRVFMATDDPGLVGVWDACSGPTPSYNSEGFLGWAHDTLSFLMYRILVWVFAGAPFRFVFVGSSDGAKREQGRTLFGMYGSMNR